MKNSRATAIGSPIQLDYSAISFLIVDDQPFSRHIIRSMLAGFGSRELYESANGSEALELAHNAMPGIIITDLMMPDSNGMKLIARLKAPESRVRQIPIIVLSGYLTRTGALSIINSGADEFLVKPVSPKALHEHIARVLLRKGKAGMSSVQGQRNHTGAGGKQRDQAAYI